MAEYALSTCESGDCTSTRWRRTMELERDPSMSQAEKRTNVPSVRSNGRATADHSRVWLTRSVRSVYDRRYGCTFPCKTLPPGPAGMAWSVGESQLAGHQSGGSRYGHR